MVSAATAAAAAAAAIATAATAAAAAAVKVMNIITGTSLDFGLPVVIQAKHQVNDMERDIAHWP